MRCTRRGCGRAGSRTGRPVVVAGRLEEVGRTSSLPRRRLRLRTKAPFARAAVRYGAGTVRGRRGGRTNRLRTATEGVVYDSFGRSHSIGGRHETCEYVSGFDDLTITADGNDVVRGLCCKLVEDSIGEDGHRTARLGTLWQAAPQTTLGQRRARRLNNPPASCRHPLVAPKLSPAPGAPVPGARSAARHRAAPRTRHHACMPTRPRARASSLNWGTARVLRIGNIFL